DYAVLRGAGVEGVRAHPGTYTRGVLGTLWKELDSAYFRGGGPHAQGRGGSSGTSDTITVDGRQLPRPTEGQPIPGGPGVWTSTPGQRIRQVWTSPTEWHFVFVHPGDVARFDRIVRRRDELFADLPDRSANTQLSRRLDQLSRWYPRPWLWILLGI